MGFEGKTKRRKRKKKKKRGKKKERKKEGGEERKEEEGKLSAGLGLGGGEWRVSGGACSAVT